MKKAGKFLTVLCLFASIILLSGCLLGEEIGDRLAPKDNWYEKTFTYKSSKGDIDVLCAFYYSDDGFSSSTCRNDVEIGSGLTLVITPDLNVSSKSEIVEEVFGSLHGFIVKNFPKNSSVQYSEEDGGKSVKMNDALWGAIYTTSLGADTEISIPNCLKVSNKSKYVNLQTFEGFNITTLLEEIIANKVLDFLGV